MPRIAITCDTCGKTIYRYPSQINPTHNYCSQECRQKKEQVFCDICGKPMIRRPSQINDTYNYCSLECNGIAHQRHAQEKTEQRCLQCGKSTYRYARQVDLGLGKFCSIECRSNYRHENALITLVCPQCENKFETMPGRINIGRTYCSVACANAAQHPPIYKHCEECGKEFRVKPSRYNTRKYCSIACRVRAVNINLAKRGERMTKIEQLFHDELKTRNARFKTQYPVGTYRLDFAFPKQKIAIECDGDYWHSLPEHIEADARKNKYLKAHGWTVFRFWGREIKEDVSQCVDEVLNYLLF